MKISSEQLQILQHSLGVDQYGKGNQYRNYFCTDLDSKDGPTCLDLCKLGLMMDSGAQIICGGMHVFHVSEQGKMVMQENSPCPPKLTRSQQRYRKYLDADCDESFGEWLTQLKGWKKSLDIL